MLPSLPQFIGMNARYAWAMRVATKY